MGYEGLGADGIGAFFYPIVLSITEKERLANSELCKPPGHGIRKIVLDHNLKDNTRVVVTDDGFVGVFKDTFGSTMMGEYMKKRGKGFKKTT